MRGSDVTQEGLFVVRSTADYVPKDHPLRPIRDILNTALREMDPVFAAMYAPSGRDSVPPEWLLRGCRAMSASGCPARWWSGWWTPETASGVVSRSCAWTPPT